MNSLGTIFFLSRARWGPVLGIWIGLLAVTAQAASLPPFTAKGTVSWEVFQTLEPAATSWMEETFVFCHSNDWWRMELKCVGGFHPRVPAESLKGNLVNCERISDGVRVVTSHAPPFNPDAWLPAEFEATEFPPPDRNDLLICWLALCPNPKLPLLSATTMRRLVSFEFLRDPENEGDYTLRYDSGHIFISELLITNNGMIQVGLTATRKLAPPFEKGHMEFEYKVLEATNWGRYGFPVRSVLRKYVNRPDGKTRDDVLAAVKASLQVDSIRYGEIASPEVDVTKVLVFEGSGRSVSGPENSTRTPREGTRPTRNAKNSDAM